MLCTKCNAEIAENSANCSTCGAKIEPDAKESGPKEGEELPGEKKKSGGGCSGSILFLLAIALVIAGIIGFMKSCS